MVYEITNSPAVTSLFANWEETLIWSCLQGIMGKLYTTTLSSPTAVMAVIGDFTFFAGTPDRELIAFQPDECSYDFRILVPQNDAWRDTITAHYGSRAKIVSRYATRKEPGIFHLEQLKKAVFSLSDEYRVCLIDEPLYEMCKAEEWSRDLVSQFPTYERYQAYGLGVAILKDGQIVSGASSYTRYRDGIEIEIDTRKDHRRKGLAYACGAKLILECQKRNLYPSWDAQNPWSLALAQKLGYHYSHTYTAIELYTV